MHTTVICHFYNEEFLLPLWLEHHKRIFDHGILIDYNSTDGSRDVIKRICPTWEIRKSRNEYFGSREIDAEVMDIERTQEGIKIALNVTEFLFCKNLQDLCPEPNQVKGINSFTVFANEGSHVDVSNITNYIKCIHRGVPLRGRRYLHSYLDGAYGIGRHSVLHTNVVDVPASEAFIAWIGFLGFHQYPELDARQVQIAPRIPQHDISVGFGYQHTWSKQQRDEYMNNANARAYVLHGTMYAIVKQYTQLE
jgi:hypothetical protein